MLPIPRVLSRALSALTARALPTLAACALLALAACAVGPDYQRPAAPLPAHFKEDGLWKTAAPKDDAPRGAWWTVFQDPTLDELVEQVESANQNVALAEAQYRQAVGLLDAASASFFPAASTNFSRSRTQGVSASATPSSGGNTVTPGSPIRKVDRLALNFSWEIDVWGRIRRSVESADAGAEASLADWAAALMSARSALVQSYLQLRANEAQRQLLDETVAAYERSLAIAKNRYDAGVAGRIDVAQAETQLHSTRAQAIDLGIQRAQLEHAIAILLGKAPAEFSLPSTGKLPELPVIPVGVPSALLEHRPDIAAAERRVAAANAQIGVAVGAFFPALTLSPTLGYQSSSGLSGLVALPNRFWSLGPSLALTLFDAGYRSAQKDQAIAAYDKSVASYRQTVLTAFAEVEDNLIALRLLDEEANVQREAARFAAESLRLTQNQYQSGIVSYLNVVTAQTTSLSAERSRIDLAGRKLLASLALLKAVGGVWPERAPTTPTPAPAETEAAPSPRAVSDTPQDDGAPP